MQDSIEDYIKISENAREEPTKARTEAQISAQRKKECDIRALKIVEFSIEGRLRPEIFIRCLPFIDQSHYQDIVEERAITKLCGYSVCGKKIPEMPKKQYYISMKSNKVYDITDRKNYCSNFCYKASLHIKNQIDNNPLWLRKLEDISKYQLLKPTEGGLPGEYIDQGIAKPAVEPSFTSISLFTEASLEDMVKSEKSKSKPSKEMKGNKKMSKFKNIAKSTMTTISESPEQVNDNEIIAKITGHENDEESCITKGKFVQSETVTPIKETAEDSELKHCTDKSKKGSDETITPINEITEQLESKFCTEKTMKKSSILPVEINTNKIKNKASKRKQVDVESIIQKAVNEWLTLETFIFIHGESKVKEILNEKKLSDCFEQLHITELQREQQVKYMNICKRLHLQEMADEKFDNALIGNSKLKPPPNYKQLKEDNKDLSLKVKCFYGGMLHEKEDTNFPTKINKNDETFEEGGPPAILPLVDASSQNALRRKVFLTSINKPMQLLLQLLRVTHFSSVLSDVQMLVKTFNLKADNVLFKPIVWNYIAIVLLHILSVRDKDIHSILQERDSRTSIELQLSSLPNGVRFINDIMTTVKCIDLFLESYISLK